jgi:DNA-directed RNA polymerase subunit RPC12/RpoP
MPNRRQLLEPMNRAPKPNASPITLSDGPLDLKNGTTDYVCGHCGAPLIVNFRDDVAFQAPVEVYIPCPVCLKNSFGPQGKKSAPSASTN